MLRAFPGFITIKIEHPTRPTKTRRAEEQFVKALPNQPGSASYIIVVSNKENKIR